MKQSTIKLIEQRFLNDIYNINYKIRKNKTEINRLAKEQKELKESRKGLYEIINLIKS